MVTLPARSKVKTLMQKLGIQPTEVKVITKNGRIIDLNERLENGDMVSFFPFIGGG
ncbi:MAG: MoaD/ThiS family protein [Bacillota bacterium]|jgi:sulfur carrier protein ThiS|nr:MoaD/ThiS family protein [Bacillota bacterium]